jgi:hypothetical protein
VPTELTFPRILLSFCSLQLSVSTSLSLSASQSSLPSPSASLKFYVFKFKLLRSVYFLHASFYESRLSSVPKESASTSRSRKTKDTLGYDLICRSAHEAERELEPTIGYSVWIAVWKHKGVTLDQSPSK